MSEDKKKRGNSFGDNLKEQRSKKYKTQKEFADILGIPATTYGQYETGRREPDFTMLLKIAELLEVSVDYLMKGIGTDSYIYILYATALKNVYMRWIYSRTKLMKAKAGKLFILMEI